MRHRRLSHDQLLRRAEAQTRPCPPAPRGCGARIGQTCRSSVTGEPLTRAPACAARQFPPLPHRPWVPEPRRAPDVRELAGSSHR